MWLNSMGQKYTYSSMNWLILMMYSWVTSLSPIRWGPFDTIMSLGHKHYTGKVKGAQNRSERGNHGSEQVKKVVWSHLKTVTGPESNWASSCKFQIHVAVVSLPQPGRKRKLSSSVVRWNKNWAVWLQMSTKCCDNSQGTCNQILALLYVDSFLFTSPKFIWEQNCFFETWKCVFQ